jgi:hypothetical protein
VTPPKIGFSWFPRTKWKRVMFGGALVAVVALLVTPLSPLSPLSGGREGGNSSSASSLQTSHTINSSVTLSGGQTLTVRCRTTGETWTGTNIYPHVITCPKNGTTTTTSVAPTTTRPPTTVVAPTTTSPATTTTRPGRGTTTTSRPVTSTTRPVTTTVTSPVTTTTQPVTTTTLGPPPAGYLTPQASLMPNSIFNRPVASDAVLSNSSAIVANVVSAYQNNYGYVGGNFNRPVYYAPPGTPDVAITVSSGCNNFTSGGAGSTGTEIPIPSYAQQGGSSDNILTVYNNTDVWEIWEAVPPSSGKTAWQGCWGGEAPLASFDGVFPANYGETATGIANLATEITEADVNSGVINHAIEFEMPGGSCDYYIPPADRGDCGQSNANYPAEGMYFRFAPGAVCSAAACSTPFAKMVFAAIQKYGMVISDMGGIVGFEADAYGSTYEGVYYPGPWEQEGESAASDPMNKLTSTDVSTLPWSSLQAIQPPS